jgi:hypothetical protein
VLTEKLIHLIQYELYSENKLNPNKIIEGIMKCPSILHYREYWKDRDRQ